MAPAIAGTGSASGTASAARRASKWAMREGRSMSRVSAMVSEARANR